MASCKGLSTGTSVEMVLFGSYEYLLMTSPVAASR